MARNQHDAPKKAGLLRRVGNYGMSRIRHQDLADQSRQNLSGAVKSARAALGPRPADWSDMKRRFFGGYADGGVARFAELAREQGMGEAQLVERQRQWKWASMFQIICGVALFIAGIFGMLTSDGSVFDLVIYTTYCLVAFMLAFVGLLLAFLSWQVKERRIGGFKEYLEALFG